MKAPAAALLLLLAAPALAAKTKAPPAESLAPAVPATVDVPRSDDPLGATIHRLPNGLTVYLSPNKGEPRITARIAVRAGSKNDPAESTGLAHYLEHMLFKGTTRLGTVDWEKEKPRLERIRQLYEDLYGTQDAAKRAALFKAIDRENVAASAFASPSEIDRFFRAIGARSVNAHTSHEETVYEVDFPANRLEAWATAEAERFRAPVFRLFQTELEAVYEEKNRSLDNAERALDDEVMRRLYKIHPYGQQPTLGTIEHLKNPSLARMQAFYDRWYVPNNMAIALSGDFDRDAALAVIRRRFGAWQPKPLPVLPVWREAPLSRPDRSELRFEAEQKVELAWPTAPASHPDADALDVMDMLADNSAAGILNLRLNQAQKVKASGSFPRDMNDAGSWHVWAVPKKGQTPEQAEALLLECVEALKNGEFTDDDVAAVVTAFEIDEKARLESNESRADLMAGSFIAQEPWERAIGRLDRLRKVTKADVVRVARQYLGDGRVVVYRRDGKPELPKIAKPEFTSVAIDPARASPFLKELLAIPAKPLEPRWLVAGRDYQITPLEAGRLFSARNPYNDLFQLTFHFDRGSRQERALCEAIDLLELSGAGPFTAEELKTKLFGLGTTLSYSCGEQESAVQLTGLDRNLWPSLELMTARFDWPNVSSGTLERMIEVELGAREDEKKNPAAVHHALGQLAMRGRDSSYLRRLTNVELQQLAESRLKSLLRGFLSYPYRAAYVGNRPAGEVAKLLQSGRALKPLPPRAPYRLLRPDAPRVLFTHRDMVQARVGLFAADEPYDPERAVDLELYNSYMDGGMDSVIWQEVRESRALAYESGGGHTGAARKGDDTSVWGYAGCQADKTVDASKLLSALLSDFPASPERFRAASDAVEQSYRTEPVRFRQVPAALIGWEDQGLSGDPRPRRFERLRAYTLQDLARYAARLKGRPMTTWVLGSRDRVDLEKLKTLGELEEKPLEALFPY